jgi:hypothetical protein
VFDFSVDMITRPEGTFDFRGPYMQGKKGKRFFYLSWGELKRDQNFEMFRRAIFHFSAIKSKDLEAAASSSKLLEGTVKLTDDRGGPICANIDSKITWRVK